MLRLVRIGPVKQKLVLVSQNTLEQIVVHVVNEFRR